MSAAFLKTLNSEAQNIFVKTQLKKQQQEAKPQALTHGTFWRCGSGKSEFSRDQLFSNEWQIIALVAKQRPSVFTTACVIYLFIATFLSHHCGGFFLYLKVLDSLLLEHLTDFVAAQFCERSSTSK